MTARRTRGDEIFLWIAGLTGVGAFIYEVVLDNQDRPWILAAATTLIGLRFTVKLDPRGSRLLRDAAEFLTSTGEDNKKKETP